MSATLVNLIIQLIAGAVGGNAVAAGMKNVDLGALGNTIAGAIWRCRRRHITYGAVTDAPGCSRQCRYRRIGPLFPRLAAVSPAPSSPQSSV